MSHNWLDFLREFDRRARVSRKNERYIPGADERGERTTRPGAELDKYLDNAIYFGDVDVPSTSSSHVQFCLCDKSDEEARCPLVWAPSSSMLNDNSESNGESDFLSDDEIGEFALMRKDADGVREQKPVRYRCFAECDSRPGTLCIWTTDRNLSPDEIRETGCPHRRRAHSETEKEPLFYSPRVQIVRSARTLCTPVRFRSSRYPFRVGRRPRHRWRHGFDPPHQSLVCSDTSEYETSDNDEETIQKINFKSPPPAPSPPVKKTERKLEIPAVTLTVRRSLVFDMDSSNYCSSTTSYGRTVFTQNHISSVNLTRPTPRKVSLSTNSLPLDVYEQVMAIADDDIHMPRRKLSTSPRSAFEAVKPMKNTRNAVYFNKTPSHVNFLNKLVAEAQKKKVRRKGSTSDSDLSAESSWDGSECDGDDETSPRHSPSPSLSNDEPEADDIGIPDDQDLDVEIRTNRRMSILDFEYHNPRSTSLKQKRRCISLTTSPIVSNLTSKSSDLYPIPAFSGNCGRDDIDVSTEEDVNDVGKMFLENSGLKSSTCGIVETSSTIAAKKSNINCLESELASCSLFEESHISSPSVSRIHRSIVQNDNSSFEDSSIRASLRENCPPLSEIIDHSPDSQTNDSVNTGRERMRDDSTENRKLISSSVLGVKSSALLVGLSIPSSSGGISVKTNFPFGIGLELLSPTAASFVSPAPTTSDDGLSEWSPVDEDSVRLANGSAITPNKTLSALLRNNARIARKRSSTRSRSPSENFVQLCGSESPTSIAVTSSPKSPTHKRQSPRDPSEASYPEESSVAKLHQDFNHPSHSQQPRHLRFSISSIIDKEEKFSEQAKVPDLEKLSVMPPKKKRRVDQRFLSDVIDEENINAVEENLRDFSVEIVPRTSNNPSGLSKVVPSETSFIVEENIVEASVRPANSMVLDEDPVYSSSISSVESSLSNSIDCHAISDDGSTSSSSTFDRATLCQKTFDDGISSSSSPRSSDSDDTDVLTKQFETMLCPSMDLRVERESPPVLDSNSYNSDQSCSTLSPASSFDCQIESSSSSGSAASPTSSFGCESLEREVFGSESASEPNDGESDSDTTIIEEVVTSSTRSRLPISTRAAESMDSALNISHASATELDESIMNSTFMHLQLDSESTELSDIHFANAYPVSSDFRRVLEHNCRITACRRLDERISNEDDDVEDSDDVYSCTSLDRESQSPSSEMDGSCRHIDSDSDLESTATLVNVDLDEDKDSDLDSSLDNTLCRTLDDIFTEEPENGRDIDLSHIHAENASRSVGGAVVENNFLSENEGSKSEFLSPGHPSTPEADAIRRAVDAVCEVENFERASSLTPPDSSPQVEVEKEPTRVVVIFAEEARVNHEHDEESTTSAIPPNATLTAPSTPETNDEATSAPPTEINESEITTHEDNPAAEGPLTFDETTSDPDVRSPSPKRMRPLLYKWTPAFLDIKRLEGKFSLPRPLKRCAIDYPQWPIPFAKRSKEVDLIERPFSSLTPFWLHGAYGRIRWIKSVIHYYFNQQLYKPLSSELEHKIDILNKFYKKRLGLPKWALTEELIAASENRIPDPMFVLTNQLRRLEIKAIDEDRQAEKNSTFKPTNRVLDAGNRDQDGFKIIQDDTISHFQEADCPSIKEADVTILTNLNAVRDDVTPVSEYQEAPSYKLKAADNDKNSLADSVIDLRFPLAEVLSEHHKYADIRAQGDYDNSDVVKLTFDMTTAFSKKCKRICESFEQKQRCANDTLLRNVQNRRKDRHRRKEVNDRLMVDRLLHGAVVSKFVKEELEAALGLHMPPYWDEKGSQNSLNGRIMWLPIEKLSKKMKNPVMINECVVGEHREKSFVFTDWSTLKVRYLEERVISTELVLPVMKNLCPKVDHDPYHNLRSDLIGAIE